MSNDESAIEALMRGSIADVADDGGSTDDIFGPLNAVAADPDAVAALYPSTPEAPAAPEDPPTEDVEPAPARRRSGAAGAASRAAVAAAVSALEADSPALSKSPGRMADEDAEQGAAAGEATGGAPAAALGAPDLRPIPRPSGQAYQPRMLEGRTDVETLRICREAGLSVMLSGFPGCGKTALVEAAFGDSLLTIAGHSDTEVGDLVGTYTQNTDGTYAWVDGPLVVAMREGRPLFVDDATLIAAGVLARLYPAMDGRGTITIREHVGETVTAEPGFYVVGAHNPGAPGAVFSEALASRFGLHIEVESDLRLASRLGVDRRAIRAAAALRTQRAQGVVTWAPEMRELLTFQKVLVTLGDQVAASNLVACAPEDSRDEVARVLHTWFPEAQALRLAGK